MYKLGLYIIYFKWCNVYHDTHELIFNTYQQYILFSLRPRNLDMATILWDFEFGNDQNTLNISKNVSFEVSFN